MKASVAIRAAFFSAGLAASAAIGQEASVLEIENLVETSGGPAGAWAAAQVGESLAVGDRIRTRQRSRAAVRISSLYTMRMEQLTTVEISPALIVGDKPDLGLSSGAVFIFSRESESGEIDIRTPAANGALRGTQLFVSVADDGRSYFQTLEGSVEVSNALGQLVIGPGEAAEAIPGQAPRRTAVIEARNLLQWALYYPAVGGSAGRAPARGGGAPRPPPPPPAPQPDDLRTDGEREPPPPAATPLEAYRQGDLLHAVGLLSDQGGGGGILAASALLSVGRLDEAEEILRTLPAEQPLRRSLERVAAAVKFEEQPEWELESLGTSSEAVAESYYLQSRSRLEGAREAARRAVELSPENGHAWTRLAELEFSFGRTRQAKAALERGLALAPRNARAHALHGFLFSAENRIPAAKRAFERAVALDGALGSGWLGLGLVKIKSGQLEAGRQDLQTAATVEPLLSVYHSYLGKAFGLEGRREDARRDLDLARRLDPDDPTPWLYSALERQQNNETNLAIRELQESIRLNDNRRVYRSRFLLDQDRAVRSANLAALYRNNGMAEVALREAARAVQSDYTNASAHLFLANAFHDRRDPKRISLRYETPWFNELLLANLLSPVGGGPLSQYVSQQEYSKLLEADGLGGSVASEWRDTGEWRTSTSLFGTSGNLDFGIDYSWRDDPGFPGRANNAAELEELYLQAKWQAGPDDIFYFLGKWGNERHGDIFDTFDNEPLAPEVAFREDQSPGLLLGGWNRRWAPGSHTLLLAGRLSASQSLSDPRAGQLLLFRDDAGLRPGLIRSEGFVDRFSRPALAGSAALAPDGESLVYSPALLSAISPFLGSGEILGVAGAPFSVATRREFEIHSFELQQIQQIDGHTLLGGVRLQEGEFETRSTMTVERPVFLGFATPAVDQTVSADFRRTSLYAYDFWSPADWLTVIGGGAWDRIDRPDNFRNPPVNDLQREDERLSGKAGLILSPASTFHIRGVFTQGLGGVTYDESVRLEPVQIAGFNQSYRTVISESLVGSVEAPRFQSWGIGLDGNFATDTWWGLTGEVVEQEVSRTLGAFDGYSSAVFPVAPAFFASGVAQDLSYREESLTATVNQLLGSEWAAGARYRLTRSNLRSAFPGIPTDLMANADVRDEALLHEFGLSLDWNSPGGLFARLEANRYSQDLRDDPAGLPPGAPPRTGDDFWQANAFVGYRFNRNLWEVSAGVLNATDRDYRLSPLTPYYDLARDRTFVLRFRASF